jgi:hypothetical protein
MESGNESKRIQANRANATKSTGPRTEEGKRASSANALGWGFWSRRALIPCENADEFAEFRERVLASTNPVGGLEGLLAERMMLLGWRLQRVLRIEAELFALHLGDGPASPLHSYLIDCRDLGAFAKLARDETRLERGFFQVLHELQRLQAGRAGRSVPLPVAADLNLDVTVTNGGGLDEGQD